MSSSPSQPLAGRRIWLAGIGGAGMSGYALLAHAWGAEVAGWDRVETPYLRLLEDIAVEISREPPVPPLGWEVFVSTAFAGRVEGRPRADLLAELVAQRQAIVVAGAHGKTTTSAMIAFCLDRLGLEPAFLIGGDVPQLGGNAGVGPGWLVVEGDESDRSVAALRPEIAVLLNVDLDHHTTFASRAELESFFEGWLRDVLRVVRAEELQPVELELRVPGEHNRRNAAAALAALELAGVSRADGEAVIVEFRGAGRRLEPKGEAGGVAVLDSYAHHPAELAADLAAMRAMAGSAVGRAADARTEDPAAFGASRGGRLLALFQPHLYSRTQHLAHGFAEALAGADAVCVTEIYPAREEPVPGVTGRLIVDELACLRPGMRIGWAPALEDAAGLVAGWARPGDTVLTLGAGDIDRAAPLILEALA
jgi:UDP-N-acetylmuramate--alanine ligase